MFRLLTLSQIEIWCLDYEYRIVGGYLHIYGGKAFLYTSEASSLHILCTDLFCAGGTGTSSRRQRMESVNWFLLMHLFFFYGALGDVTTACIDSFTDTDNTTWWSMWSDFFASSLCMPPIILPVDSN